MKLAREIAHMKRLCLTAALAFACSAAFAQAPAAEVPKASCEPKPSLPLINDKMVQRNFDRDLKAYKDCIKVYVDAREAAIKANQEAANAAISEYNGVLTTLKDQQSQGRGSSSTSSDKKY